MARKKRTKQLMQSDICDFDEEISITKLSIPAALKTHMVEEWDLISHEPRSLLALPRTPNVVSIIEDFLSLKQKKVDSEQYLKYTDLFTGLRGYFDRALPKILLYRHERDQWEMLKQIHQSPSKLYGAEHLIRLYVKLPRLLSMVTMNASELSQTQGKFLELLNYIQKNSDTLILKSAYILREEAMHKLKTFISNFP